MSGPIDFGHLPPGKAAEYTRAGEAWRHRDHVRDGIAAVIRGEPIPEPPPPAEPKPHPPSHPGVIPPAPEKVEAWASKWEQRFATGYVVRDDEKRFPRPAVKPPPVPAPLGNEDRRPGEPSSAPVIRALERQINGGQLVGKR